MLPLLPLTQNGAQREVVDKVISRLTPPGEEPKAELLTLTYGLASLILINEADQEWLIRRFGQMYDILRETRAYQELIKDGLEQGLQQGLQQGIEQGLEQGIEQGQQEKLQEMRETLLDVIMELFPRIRIPAQEQVDAITNTALLRQLIVKIHAFKSPEEALQYLREINAYNEKR